jgi:transcriptional regulator with XRE-family HTH domain
MSKLPNVSLRSRWLGERLRAARTEAGYKLVDVAEFLQMDHTTLGRFERGTHRIRRSYVRDLIDFYGISDEQTRDVLLKLNEDSWRRDWWVGDASGLEVSFVDFTWLEARAALIRAFEPMLLPGLLQIREYADAVMAHGRGDEIKPALRKRLVGLRMARQGILHGSHPTPYSVVLEESSLWRPIGSVRTRRLQLAHLLELGAEEHIDIRVLPISIGWHVGVTGPFRYFEMPDPYPDVASVESLVGRTFLEEEKKTTRYRDAHSELRSTALNPERSAELIRNMMKDLE